MVKSVITVLKWLKVLTVGPESVTKVDAPVPACSGAVTVNWLPGVGATGRACVIVNDCGVVPAAAVVVVITRSVCPASGPVRNVA